MNILYNTDEIKHGANHIQNQVGELKQIINNINNEINKISPQWEGKAKGEFIVKYENSKTDINAYIDCIAKISEKLTSVANLAESADHDASCFNFFGR